MGKLYRSKLLDRPMAHGLLSEADVCSTFGLGAETLRLYRDRRLVVPVPIAEEFYYTAKDLVRLQVLEKGKRLGFSLTEIEAIIRDHSGRDVPKRPSTSAVAPAEVADKAMRLVRLERRKSEIQAEIDALQSPVDD